MDEKAKIAASAGRLAAQDRYFLRSFDRLNCGILATGDGVVIAMNRKLLDWLGYEEEEILGRPLVDFVPPEVRAMVQQEREAARESGVDARARLLAMQRKDGSTFPVLALPRVAAPEGSEIIGSFIVIIELGALQTAKRLGAGDYDLASSLQRIALELEALGLAAQMPGSKPLALGHPRLASLSNREREVLMHLVAGERVPAIAGNLFISPHTVRNHLKNIYSKLQVHSQSELIALARGLSS